ncbi:unnamed protein product, partial [Polarella glacialis]
MGPLLFTGVVVAYTAPAAQSDVSDACLCVPMRTILTSTSSIKSATPTTSSSTTSTTSTTSAISLILDVVPDLASERHMGDAVGNASEQHNNNNDNNDNNDNNNNDNHNNNNNNNDMDPRMEDGPSLPGSPEEFSDPVVWSPVDVTNNNSNNSNNSNNNNDSNNFVAVSDILSRADASTDQVAGRQTGHSAVAQQQQQRPQRREEQHQLFPQRVDNHARFSKEPWKEPAKTSLPPVTRAGSKKARLRNTDPNSDARQPPEEYRLHSVELCFGERSVEQLLS